MARFVYQQHLNNYCYNSVPEEVRSLCNSVGGLNWHKAWKGMMARRGGPMRNPNAQDIADFLALIPPVYRAMRRLPYHVYYHVMAQINGPIH